MSNLTAARFRVIATALGKQFEVKYSWEVRSVVAEGIAKAKSS